MRNIKTIFLLIVLAGLFSCKAQQTIASLKQIEECGKRPESGIEPCPGMENITQVKDIDNRLNAFEGIWKGTFQGKQIELNLIKKVNFGENNVKWDKLIGKLKVKDIHGNILFDSFQNVESMADPRGINFQYSVYEMRFSGKNDCGSGKIYLETPVIFLNGNIKLDIFYAPDGDAVDTAACPKLLPLEWTELTKQ